MLTHVKITLSEALLGFDRILVTHLDGRGVRVSSPPGKVIRPDDTIILRGEGMPVFKQPDQKGDLFVVLNVEMPSDQWLKAVDTEVSVGNSLISSEVPSAHFLPGIGKVVATQEARIGSDTSSGR